MLTVGDVHRKRHRTYVRFVRSSDLPAKEIDRRWLEAEAATRGNMVNRAGKAAGLDERSLLTGPGVAGPPVRVPGTAQPLPTTGAGRRAGPGQAGGERGRCPRGALAAWISLAEVSRWDA